MWGTHFSPLFDASLGNEWMHRLEHGLYLVAAFLFWWPVVGPDPSPWRMSPPVKVLYVGLQMPQNTFLAVAITMATAPLYAHYVTTFRTWGPTPLEDQQMAGGLMWLGGDMMFLSAVILLVYAWMRDEERRTPGEDRRVEAERAAIREREAKLAARLAAEVADGTMAAQARRVAEAADGTMAVEARPPTERRRALRSAAARTRSGGSRPGRGLYSRPAREWPTAAASSRTQAWTRVSFSRRSPRATSRRWRCSTSGLPRRCTPSPCA